MPDTLMGYASLSPSQQKQAEDAIKNYSSTRTSVLKIDLTKRKKRKK